jgi:succinylarginine dihydrolase
MLTEINFDGLVGPSHNYGGLSLGNLASARNLGSVSHPRAAALQGLAKMRANLGLGLVQGILPPHARPDARWLEALATTPENADTALRANAMSAAAMWTANAATVSPAPDSADGRCHLTAANLMTMPHRSHEWPETLAQLRCAFAGTAHFAVHPPVPAPFGDEGAANHMRLCASHDAPGVEVFVYGRGGGPFPARQHREASAAIARRHRLDPERVLFVEQNPAAIAAGAFHNDVVAVANGQVLLTHEQAFADRERVYADLRRLLPEIEIVEVPASSVSLDQAVASYLFNAQLIDQPGGSMALVLPGGATAMPPVRTWLDRQIASNGPIRRLVPVDLSQSMANGGGPACLRLRVVCDPATVDPRFLVDCAKLDRIEAVVAAHWPESITVADLASPALWSGCMTARAALLETLGMPDFAG